MGHIEVATTPSVADIQSFTEQFRKQAEPYWNPLMRSPFYEEFHAQSTGFDAPGRGYCAPSSISLQQSLKKELGVSSRLAFGAVKHVGSVAILYHVWLHIPSKSFEAPIVVDVTADQGFGLEKPVIVEDADVLEDTQQICYRSYGEGSHKRLRPDCYARGVLLTEAMQTLL